MHYFLQTINRLNFFQCDDYSIQFFTKWKATDPQEKDIEQLFDSLKQRTSHWPGTISKLPCLLHRFLLTEYLPQHKESEKEFILDSFPISVCHNRRINRCHIYQKECFRDYNALKKQYFYCLKAHLLTTQSGKAIEVVFTPGGEHDCKAFKKFHLNIPKGSRVYADAAYEGYEEEDFLQEFDDIDLMVDRRKNLSRQNTGARNFLIKIMRKKIETAFSTISSSLPKAIHAVTA